MDFKAMFFFVTFVIATVKATDFSSDAYKDLANDFQVPALVDPIPESARIGSRIPPGDKGYTESSAPNPPVTVGGGLVLPLPVYQGVTRTFTNNYDHIVVFGACVRVKVIVDAFERVVIRGPVPQQFNNVYTWVSNGVLYMTASGVTPAQLAAMDITIYVNSRANVVSVTAASTGIVTLVDATNPIARNYQLFLYLYYSAQIIEVRAVVLQINTYIYGSGRIFIVGNCYRHHITGQTSHINALGLYTRYTDLSLWDSSFAFIRASVAISGMAGGSSFIFYAVPPVPTLNIPNNQYNFFQPF